MAALPCKDWNDIPGHFLAKTAQALFAVYTGLVVFSTTECGLFVLLLYPVAVQLLLLDGLERYAYVHIYLNSLVTYIYIVHM